MKKIKSAAIIFAMLFLLCGCSHSEAAPDTQAEETSLFETKTTITPATTLYPVTTQAATTIESTSVYTSAQTTFSQTEKSTAEQSTSLNVLEDLKNSFIDFFGRFTRPSSDNEPADVTVLTTSKSSTTKAVTTAKVTTEKKTTEKKTTKPTTKRETTQKQTTKNITEPSLQTEYVTLTISVVNIKNNISLLPKEKRSFVPKSGYILKEEKVEISDGDTAFDVLKNGCERNVCTDGCVYCKSGSIQLEYSFTPAYKSYYVEGIHQLYEKDCGALSGWIYMVNGIVHDSSSSTCHVKNGDNVTFVYTCDGGNDIN